MGGVLQHVPVSPAQSSALLYQISYLQLYRPHGDLSPTWRLSCADTCVKVNPLEICALHMGSRLVRKTATCVSPIFHNLFSLYINIKHLFSCIG